MLTSVIPEDTDELGLVTFLSNLLEVDRKAVRRCIQRGRDTFGYHGFVSVLHLPRAVRWSSIVYGRLVAREFWHAMCRLDTRPGAPRLHTTTTRTHTHTHAHPTTYYPLDDPPLLMLFNHLSVQRVARALAPTSPPTSPHLTPNLNTLPMTKALP